MSSVMEKEKPGATTPGNAESAKNWNNKIIPDPAARVKPRPLIVPRVHDLAEAAQGAYWESVDVTDHELQAIGDQICEALAAANGWIHDRRWFPVDALAHGLHRNQWVSKRDPGLHDCDSIVFDHPRFFTYQDGRPAAIVAQVYAGRGLSSDHRARIQDFAARNNLVAIVPGGLDAWHHPGCRVIIYLPGQRVLRAGAA